MPHDRDETQLDPETEYLMRGLSRSARRLVLAITQTTNPKRVKKLKAQLNALRSSRTAR